MLSVALQGVRGRRAPFAGAFVALSIAAAVVMASGTLVEAALRAGAPVERYAATPIVVAGSQELPVAVSSEDQEAAPLFERVRLAPGLVRRLAAVPGVRAAIADLSVPAELRTEGSLVPGPGGHPNAVHPWDTAVLTAYRLDRGRAPLDAGDIVVDAGLARRGRLHIGSRVRLTTTGPVQTATVVGIASTAAAVARQGVLFATRKEVERLVTPRPGIDAVGILPKPGADRAALAQRLRQVATDHARVLTGSRRGEVEHLELLDTRNALLTICATFGGLVLFIAMFVVASTIGIAVVQRHREIALLRAVAATPRQVRRMVRWEALFVALAAGAAGVVPGWLLGRTLGHALEARGMAPEDLQVHLGPIPAAVAIVATALVALGAVAAAGRRAARVHPSQALQESAAEPVSIGITRLVAGLAVLGAGCVLLVTAAAGGNASSAADAATVSSFVLIIATALLGPVIARLVAGAASRALDRTGPVETFLATSNIRTSPRRFASAMTPLVLSVAMASQLLLLETTRDRATSRESERRVTADLLLRSDGGGLPASAAADARAVPGVRAAVGVARTSLGPGLGNRFGEVAATVVEPAGLTEVLDLDVRRGSLADLGTTGIALSTDRARSARATVGKTVALTLGDGAPARGRVAAIYDRELGFGDVVLTPTMANGHRTSPLLDEILVRTDADASRPAVSASLRSLAARYPGLTVEAQSRQATAPDHERETIQWLFRLITAVIFVFTAIAAINTLMMIGMHRARELALLQLVGATGRQVRAMARREAAILVAIALTLGTTIGVTALMPTSSVLSGSPIPYAPIPLIALLLLSAAGIALGGSEVATRLAMRPRPVDAIGIQD